jgi:FtsP/CotA-like multicopper oxidase with cupredoxin domain
VAFTWAFLLDLGAAGLAVVLVGAAAAVPARARPLLVAGLGALLIRVAAGLALADHGWIFATRPLLVDLPLSLVPVLAALAWSRFGSRTGFARVGRNLVWTAAAACVVAAIDPLLLPSPVPLAALSVLALVAPWVDWSAVRPLTVVAGLLIGGLVLATGLGWWNSRLPGRYDLADFADSDPGVSAAGAAAQTAGGHSGGHAGGHSAGGSSTPVTALTGPAGTPDVRVNLTAAPLRVQRDGRSVEAVAFNGAIPGPPIRAALGDLVEVHVCNRGDAAGVSVHWHGYDVPNAEDGVAGVTQDAIPDGGCHDYRFRADRAGSYWYHAHQDSSSQVDRGLYGALLVAEQTAPAAPTDPQTAAPADLVVLDHAWRPPGGYLAGADWDPGERVERTPVPLGSALRLRLVNTDRVPHRYRLTGARFRVTAVDGTAVAGPGELDGGRTLVLAAGGRYDLGFTMPAGGVRLSGLGDDVSLLLAGPPGNPGPAASSGPAKADLDLLSYGRSTGSAGGAATAEGPAAGLLGRPDREFSLVMDRRVTFAGGRASYGWAVNGQTYPRMPMLMVTAGDLVRVRLVNRTIADHPMHLHGHHVLVLSRNGTPASGSPWWSDTLNVAPGEDYVVAFRADNPGIWMDHCHDLKHAADGFVLHLAYTGVSTPFRIGADTANRPE